MAASSTLESHFWESANTLLGTVLFPTDMAVAQECAAMCQIERAINRPDDQSC